MGCPYSDEAHEQVVGPIGDWCETCEEDCEHRVGDEAGEGEGETYYSYTG